MGNKLNIIYGGLAIILVCYVILKLHSQKGESHRRNHRNEIASPKDYQSKWLFSYNEKSAYKKLKEIIDETEYTLFAKVRLLDLVEPKKGTSKYKTALWKIQAKHVDFVLCDKKLIARFIIELDDSSHDTKERKERDEFVDAVLKNTGYKILHTRVINKDIILEFINQEDIKPQETNITDKESEKTK